MISKHDEVIAQKSELATKVLRVAEQALDDIEATMNECSTRDLINIFNSSIKVHRELLSDIVSIQESESKSERELAKDQAYTSKVDDLLKKLSQGNNKNE